MIDRIHITPEALRLKDAAVQTHSTLPFFYRWASQEGQHQQKSLILGLQIDRYAPVRLVAHRLDDGGWWVKRIEACLPSLLHGHNGRLIQSEADYALSLTRLRYIVGLAVTDGGLGNILPGPDGSGTFINYVECSAQFQDPDRAFLQGSHLARLRYQQGPTRVYCGESSHFKKRDFALSIYDKEVHLMRGFLEPSGMGGTRAEAIFKDPAHLAKQTKKTRRFVGSPGPSLATLSLDTAYALLRKGLADLSGFSLPVGSGDSHNLSSTARKIVAGLGNDIVSHQRVEDALANYLRLVGPRLPHFRKVAAEVRAFAVRTAIKDPWQFVPENLSDLKWSEVHWPLREDQWSVLMRDIGAPDQPDPAILKAWSQTTFLPVEPCSAVMVGPVAPSVPLFRQQKDVL